jgi:hypothetical protein
LLNATGETVESPNEHNIEQPAAGISHQFVQTGAALFRAAGTIRINPMRRPSPLCDEGTDRLLLDLWILVKADLVAVPGPA